MRIGLAVMLGLGVAASSNGCTQRQNPNTCVTGDQKSCACLGGGSGIQVCLADGTYGSCLCPFATDDMGAPSEDMAASTTAIEDMSAMVPPIDMATPPDAASTCFGAAPDEDSDGLANSCDACPADSDATPVDTDGDGLPDACDPNPAITGNELLYFEPFDVVNANWSGDSAATVAQSFINLDPGQLGILYSSNATDALPLSVRVQTSIFPKGYYTGGGTIDTGLFVGTSANPEALGTSGVLCRLNSSSNSLDILPVQNGTLVTGTSAGLTINAGFYRMRLTHRAGNWTCDTTFNGTTTTVTTTQAVTAPLYMSLRTENMFVHFHSVVAESVRPVSFSEIQSDIDQKTCSLGACHGANQIPIWTAMATGSSLMTNYNSFIAYVNTGTPAASLVLTRPLPGSGHGGGTQFQSTSDPVYKRWLGWIEAGAPF
jgi:hypothetical protein